SHFMIYALSLHDALPISSGFIRSLPGKKYFGLSSCQLCQMIHRNDGCGSGWFRKNFCSFFDGTQKILEFHSFNMMLNSEKFSNRSEEHRLNSSHVKISYA